MAQDDANSLLENVNEKIHAVLVINAEGGWTLHFLLVSLLPPISGTWFHLDLIDMFFQRVQLVTLA